MVTEWYLKNIAQPNNIKGFYVEIGVYNGKTQNSTKWLEAAGWNGLLVEPMPENIKKIKKNRSAFLIEGAVWTHDGEVELIDTGVGGHSGITVTHRAPELAIRKIKVKSYRFKSLPVPKNIDYLQIDTEGSELEILGSINMQKYKIDYICIEDTFGYHENNPKYHDFMTNIGYEKIHQHNQDSLYKKI